MSTSSRALPGGVGQMASYGGGGLSISAPAGGKVPIWEFRVNSLAHIGVAHRLPPGEAAVSRIHEKGGNA